MTARFTLLYRALCWTALLTLASVCSAYGAKLTDEEKAYIKRKGSIIFVSQTRYPPFEFVDKHGQHEGMMLDVVRWLAVEMGFQPVFTDMSFQKAQKAVLSGKADVLTSLFYSDKRNESFEFTDTLFPVPASIFVRAERTDINKLASLNGKIIAMQAGDYAKEFLESKGIKFEVLETKDFGEATDMVIAGKADAVIGDEQIVLYHIFSNRLTEHVKKVGEPLYIGKDCMAGSKANALLMRILNKGVEEARKAGVLDKISKKWLGTLYGPHESWISRYRWSLSIVATGILLLSLWVWIWNLRLRTVVRRATEDIRGTVSLLQSTLESTADGILVVDRQGRITAFNKRFQEMWGIPDEVMESGDGTNVLDCVLISLKDQQEFINKVRELYAEPTVESFDVIEFKDGRVFERLSRAQQRDSEIVGRVWSFRDVTDRKKAEEALRESEERFSLFMKHFPGLTYVKDAEGRCLFANQGFKTYLGMDESRIVGRTNHDLFPADFADKISADDRQVLESGKPKEIEEDFGGLLWSTVKFPILKPGERPLLAGFTLDITDRKRAEQALRESQEKLAAIFETCPDSITVTRLNDGTFLDVNRAFTETMGYTLTEIAGIPWKQLRTFVNQDDRPSMIAQLKQYGRIDQQEIEFRRKDGSLFWGALSAVILDLAEEQCVLAVTRDITERKRAEVALRNSEKRLRKLMDHSPMAIAVTHMTGEMEYVNKRFAQTFGYTLEDIPTLDQWLSQAYRDREYAELVRSEWLRDTRSGLKNGKEPQPQERQVTCKDGTTRVVDFRKTVIDERVIHTLHDITEHKRSEEALRESEERYRSLFEQSKDAIGISREGGEFVDVNESFARLLGYSKEEILEINVRQIWAHPADRRTWQKEMLKKGSVEEYEWQARKKDGSAIDCVLSSTHRRAKDGSLLYQTIWRDVTDLKRTEDLVVGQRDLSFSLSGTSDLNEALNFCIETALKLSQLDSGGIYLINEDHSLSLAVHRGLSDRFIREASVFDPGSMQAELAKKGQPVFYNHSELVANEMDGVVHEGLTCLAIMPVLHSGSVVACFNMASHELEKVPVWTGRTLEVISAYIGSAIARIKAETEAREARERLQMLFDTLDDFVFVLGEDGRILQFNPAVQDRLGYSGEELLNMMVLELHPPARREEASTIIGEMLSGKTSDCPIPLMTKTGDLIPVETKVSRGQWGGRDVLFGISRDITQRRKAEELMLQSHRNRAVADLSAGVAHNFNNLLQIILGNASLSLLNTEVGDFSRIGNSLKEIIEASRFGAETVRRLNRFTASRDAVAVSEIEVFDLSDLVKQAAEMSAPWWKTSPERAGIRILLNTRLRDGCLSNGRKNEIFEVLVNIIKNATEALPEGGDIDIETSIEGDWTTVRISDNGIGIPEEDRGRLFTPFFTTSVEAGRGLGLATAQKIVNEHGGQILVESALGKGTTFTVQLPLSRDHTRPVQETSLPEPVEEMTVLAIDDMEGTVRLLKEGLEQHRHSVLTALSGEEGIELFEENPVDLVICDLGMPGMNGWDVGKAIKSYCEEKNAVKPPFIILTGWADQSGEKEKMEQSGVDAVVEKPVDISRLLEVIKGVVETKEYQ